MEKPTKITIAFLILFLSSFFARAVADTLQTRLNEATGLDKLQLLIQLSETYSVRTPALSLEYAQQALALANEQNYPAGRAQAQNSIGEYYLNNGNYTKAAEYFEQALQIGQSLQDNALIATSMTKVAVVSYFRGNYQQALNQALLALPLHKKEGNMRALANTQNIISYVYNGQGLPEKALEYALQALRTRRSLNDANEIAKSLNSLGDFYYNQYNLRKALRNYLESLRISRQINNQRGIAFSLTNVGKVYLRQERYQESLLYFREALTISEKLNNAKQSATIHSNMGNAYLGLNDTDRAFRYYSAALRIHYTQNNNLDIVPVLNEIGKLYAHKGDFKTALSFHYQALSKVKNTQWRLLKLDTYKSMADTYLAMNDERNFTEFYRMYSRLQDSVRNDISMRKIAELQTRFEWEESQERTQSENQQQTQEIERQKTIRNYLLTIILVGSFLGVTLIAFYISRLRGNRKLKAQNETIIHKNRQLRRVNEALKGLNDKLVESEAELRKTNETKDKFFSIIAHDLRAPLATFSSFLTALSDSDDSFTPEEIEFITKSTQKSLKNLTDLLNNLLQWSRSQMGRLQFNPQPIMLHELTQQTVNLFVEDTSNKSITLTSNVDLDAVAFADANMLDFVVRNLVSNAIKFTPKGGRIVIESVPAPEPNRLGIRVTDTGVGISPENMQKLFVLNSGFTTIGTANEKGTGLGLLLCKEFVERNGGALSVESEIGKGTSFTFTIPRSTSGSTV